jgi:predicted DsbA family dithiol-disulfide isomerase
VPFFVFGDRLAVSGAQPLEVLVRAMDEAARLPPK